MIENLERKNRRLDMPYDPEEPEDITKSLMKLFRAITTRFLGRRTGYLYCKGFESPIQMTIDMCPK
jgi:hypothetical protein